MLHLSILLLFFIYIKALQQPPLTKTWSNRYGSLITPIATGVWSADRPFKWNMIDVGGRMVIARTTDGSLLVHSPVEWTDELSKAIDKLGGGVGHIIAPNYEHLKYTKQWADTYPTANVYACPGLVSRMPEVKFTHEFSVTNTDEFSTTCEWLWLNCEENPFNGKPFFNEIIFFHKLSKTLFCADAFWNYPTASKPNYFGVEGTGDLHVCSKAPMNEVPPGDGNGIEIPVPFGTKAWAFGMNRIYLPFYKRFMIRKYKDEYKAAVSKILSWDVQTIAPCHGDIIKGKTLCNSILQKHFTI
jgi:hypothetical protein